MSARLTKAQRAALEVLRPGYAVRKGRGTRAGENRWQRRIDGRVGNTLVALGFAEWSGSDAFAITYAGALAIGDPDAVELSHLDIPAEAIDAELRGVGLDPDDLAKHGRAFVEGVKAELANKCQCDRCSDNLPHPAGRAALSEGGAR